MNHLAYGGYLQHSVQVMFKSTPVNAGIQFFTVKFPPKTFKADIPPPVCGIDAQYQRLMTSNMRAECGITKKCVVQTVTTV